MSETPRRCRAIFWVWRRLEGCGGTGLEWRHNAPGQPPSAEKPSGIPRRALPSPNDKSTSQLRCKGPPRLKTWSPTGYGANGSYYKRAPGAWEPSRVWAGTCRHRLIRGQGHSLPTWRWGPGGSTLAPGTLAVITTRAGHCQDHPMDGNLGPGRIGLGLLLGGSPFHSWALGEGVVGTNSDFQQSMGEAVRLKDRVPRDRG